MAFHERRQGEKRCKKCLEVKDCSEFYSEPEMLEGILNTCKTCEIAAALHRHGINAPRRRLTSYSHKGYRVHDGLKRCSVCEALKPVGEYRRNASGLEGLTAKCKSCLKEYDRERRRKNRYRTLATGGAMARLRREFPHVTLDEIEEWCRRREVEPCSICGERGRIMEIDHDHNTGLIRGILCHPCNIMMQRFDRCPSAVYGAMAYVHRHYPIAQVS